MEHGSAPSNGSSPADSKKSSSSGGSSSSSKRPRSPQVMPSKKSRTKRVMESSCNCDELRFVQCVLETKDLWDKFHDLETEMIITKTGR